MTEPRPIPGTLSIPARLGHKGCFPGWGDMGCKSCHRGCERLWASAWDVLAGGQHAWELGEGSGPPALPRAPVRKQAGQKSSSSPLLPDFSLPCPGLLGDLLPTLLTSPWDPSSTICRLEKPCSLSCFNPQILSVSRSRREPPAMNISSGSRSPHSLAAHGHARRGSPGFSLPVVPGLVRCWTRSGQPSPCAAGKCKILGDEREENQ